MRPWLEAAKGGHKIVADFSWGCFLLFPKQDDNEDEWVNEWSRNNEKCFADV